MSQQLAGLMIARVKASRPGSQVTGIAVHQCVNGQYLKVYAQIVVKITHNSISYNILHIFIGYQMHWQIDIVQD